MLASTHKIVGSLTQSAMLHVARQGRVDIGAIARAVRLVRSTSPSSLLMASLDAARRQLAVHGETCSTTRSQAASRNRGGDRQDPGLRSRRRASSSAGPAIAGWDPLRIVDRRPRHRLHRLRGGGRRCARPTTRTSSSRRTRRSCSCSGSASRSSRSSGSRTTSARRFGGSRERRSGRPRRRAARAELEQRDRSSRRATRSSGRSEAVAVDEAVGRISCESIAGYPPGVPTLLPGERVTRRVVDYLRALTAGGRASARCGGPDVRDVPRARLSDAYHPPQRGRTNGPAGTRGAHLILNT